MFSKSLKTSLGKTWLPLTREKPSGDLIRQLELTNLLLLDSTTQLILRVTVDDVAVIYGTLHKEIDDDVFTDINEDTNVVHIWIQKLETGHWPLGVVESLDGRIDAWSEVLMGRHSEAAKEYADALRHYQAAAALNAPQAMLRLGELYSSEVSVCQQWGITQNFEQAVEMFGQAAELKDKEGFYRLGLACMRGRGVTKNRQLAIELLGQASEAGHVEATNLIGQLHLEDEQYDMALTWLTLAASKGSAQACQTLGQLYWTGEDGHVDVDLEAAIDFYERANRLDASFEVPPALIAAMKKQDPDWVAHDEVEEVHLNKVAVFGTVTVISLLLYLAYRRLRRE